MRFHIPYKIISLNLPTSSKSPSWSLVDKVIIDQNSVAQFISYISPGAYKNLTDINFRNMDSVIVKPVGVYGSKGEIIRLMKELNVIDHSTYVFISYYQNTILKSYPFVVLLFSPLPIHTSHPTKRYALDYTH